VRLHEGNDVLDWIVTRMRTRYGGNVVGHHEGMLPLIRAVRAGRWLYYLPDEDQGAENGVFVPFYGVPKATVPSLGRLADACNAMVLPMASGYSVARGRFWIRFLPAREVHATGDPVNDARQVNELLESLIDLDPAQYMWSYKIFRTRPAGERKVY
jgi:lauroyl-KDO2-lipid IV(A) myristoyltransferase